VISAPGEESYYGPGGPASVSDETRELVDREVRRIVEGCYDRARRMLKDNRERLESLTRALLEQETLDQDDAYRAAGWEPGSAPGDSAPDARPAADAPDTPAAELPTGS
jgi:cell division protease FtsH